MTGRKRSVAVDPATESAITELRNRAKKLLAQQDYDEAIDLLDQAIALNKDSYKLYRLRSIAFACIKDYEQSSDDASRVIELAPGIMDGYHHKGFAEYHLKHYPEAARAFEEGLRINPTDKAMQQGFWDAITLISQNRTDATALVVAKEEKVREAAAAAEVAAEAAAVAAAAAIQHAAFEERRQADQKRAAAEAVLQAAQEALTTEASMSGDASSPEATATPMPAAVRAQLAAAVGADSQSGMWLHTGVYGGQESL